MTDSTFSHRRLWPRAQNPIRKALAWHELARQRRALRNLDPKLLNDIGIPREQALREARRPFWDAPDHWLAD